MILKIDPGSPKPVYRQIVDQVRYAVAAGRLREGDRLEPIRDLAARHRVNRNTVARAYLDLEREGVIRTRPGQGSFVAGEAAGNPGKARTRRELADALDGLLARAHQGRLTEEEFLDLVKERLGKVNLKED